MSRHISEFVSVAPNLLSPGWVLAANLHVYMPLNKSIVFFRRAGDVITVEDCARIQSLPKGTLLVHRSEREALMAPLAQSLAQQLRDGPISSPAIKQGASDLLKGIEAQASPGATPSGELARELLNQVPKIVETVVTTLEKAPSVQSYERLLKQGRSQAMNPVIIHNQQVSAIAVLIRMTAGPDPRLGGKGESTEDLAAIGAAGLMHDLGLIGFPKPLVEKHLIGDDELTVSEKEQYFEHIERTQEIISASKGASISEETLLAIAQHHENHDGSGYKTHKGEMISYAAKIIRIADDIVASINHPANSFGFREALGHLHWKERQNHCVAYDPDLMNLLGDLE